MADEWDDLPMGGIERDIWLGTAAAVVMEMRKMMGEYYADKRG